MTTTTGCVETEKRVHTTFKTRDSYTPLSLSAVGLRFTPAATFVVVGTGWGWALDARVVRRDGPAVGAAAVAADARVDLVAVVKDLVDGSGYCG